LITKDSDFTDEMCYSSNTRSEIIVLRTHPSIPKHMAERLNVRIRENGVV